jgi:hypothetical protein
MSLNISVAPSFCKGNYWEVGAKSLGTQVLFVFIQLHPRAPMGVAAAHGLYLLFTRVGGLGIRAISRKSAGRKKVERCAVA